MCASSVEVGRVCVCVCVHRRLRWAVCVRVCLSSAVVVGVGGLCVGVCVLRGLFGSVRVCLCVCLFL